MLRTLPAAWLSLALFARAACAVPPTPSLRVVPATVLEHEPFTVILRLDNAGTVEFEVVDLSLVSVSEGHARADIESAPAVPSRLTIPPAATREFTWKMRAAAAGPLTFTAEARGPLAAAPMTASAAGSILPKTDGVTIYPVPAAGDSLRVAMYLPLGADRVTVEAYNGSFERVFREVWTSLPPGRPEVAVNGLLSWAPGMYLVRVRADLGNGETITFPLAKAVVER